jgi:hypothetical protein
MKAISYALFGYGKAREANSFDFNSYLRGLMINVRVNRILYPDWITVVNIDQNTFNSQYNPIFMFLQEKGFCIFNSQLEDEPLCKKMLWRLDPIFAMKEGEYMFTHVICRDLDSVVTYREAQAVQEWLNEGRFMHCITDSISHTIPMLGGMVGFYSSHFRETFNVTTLKDLLSGSQIDYNVKGSDQSFLNAEVYPKLLDSATEHFIKGMPWNLPETNGRHYRINENIDIPVETKYKEINNVCGHIGAAGYYEVQMMQFLRHMDPYEKDYREIETQFKNIFYWREL